MNGESDVPKYSETQVIFKNEKFIDQEDTNFDKELVNHTLKRSMTSTQEIWNAVTILPGAIYCLYFLFGGLWQKVDFIEIDFQDFELSRQGCINWPFLSHLYAIPPLPVIAVATGITAHAPVSFLYHTYCAFIIPPGPLRMSHWTRKLDQCFIHLCSMLWSYGSSGDENYFWISVAYNMDCIFRLYRSIFKPKRIMVRMALSLAIQIIPLIFRGEYTDFITFLLIYSIGGWLFVKYPLGGWSHSAFHLVFALSPPLMITSATKLKSGQIQAALALSCKLSAS